jgi:hypothetical protein
VEQLDTNTVLVKKSSYIAETVQNGNFSEVDPITHTLSNL